MTVIEEIPYSRAVPSALGGWINRNAPVLCVFAAIFAGWELAVRFSFHRTVLKPS